MTKYRNTECVLFRRLMNFFAFSINEIEPFFLSIHSRSVCSKIEIGKAKPSCVACWIKEYVFSDTLSNSSRF